MPSCQQLLQQLSGLQSQLNSLAAQLLTAMNALNTAVLNAINGDNCGGSMPSVPVNAAGVAARVSYLDGIASNPSSTQQQIDDAHTAITLWNLVTPKLNDVATKQAAYDAKDAEVEAKEEECELNGCFDP